MKKIFKTVCIFSFILGAHFSYAQGQYFEVVCRKGAFSGTLTGAVQPLNNQPYVILNYKNKNKRELLKIMQSYLKNRPGLKLDHLDTSDGAFIVYRDFATVGGKEKCFADLVAISFISVIPEDGKIEVDLGLTSKIFSSIFDAKLRISPDNIVASDGDVPFNEYKIVQPADESVLTSSVWLGTRSKKRDLKSAYPDSVFDPGGKIVNPVNKKIIETFYDGYIADLKAFFDKNSK